ncbi:MAG: hypothetical protein H6733_03285 [Alphaproteobacteria bacterium]|nr:hypothetical protein [Alphaproteobacteria bacterium]
MIIDRIRDVQKVPEVLTARGKEARKWVRQRVFEVREQGETSLWKLHLNALERANELVGRAADVPVLDKVGTRTKSLLDVVEKVTTHPPLEDYDNLSVRKVMSHLHELDRFGLLRIARYEAAHKNRKTILDAIEREEVRRARLAAA